jgi:hypothetical protein
MQTNYGPLDIEVNGRTGRAKMVGGGVVGHVTGTKSAPNTRRCLDKPKGEASMTVARAGSNPASSPYKSKWESSYAAKLDLEMKAGFITAYWYEPFSLWLPGNVRYKPDFLVQRRDPQYVVSIDCTMPTILEVVEVKGWSKNLRDGLTRLKIAAALFPCFTWTLVEKNTQGGWDDTHIS